MPAIKQKTAIKTPLKSRVRDGVISLLATPLNLLVIGLRIIWSGRRLRLAALALLLALMGVVTFNTQALSPLAAWAEVQTYRLTAQAGFRVNDITVEGRKRTQREDLLSVIGVEQNAPIFALDLDAIHARIEDLPWVEKAVVSRRLPNLVHVRLNEREAFAFYRDDNELTLIDRGGVSITSHHLRQFAHLPVFSGQGATLRAADFMDLLADYPVLRNRMIAAHWTGDRRWTIQLDHGGEVHLPATGISAALDRLMQLESDRRILAEKNQAIDLRLPDRVLLRPREERRSTLHKVKGAAS